MYLSHLSLYNFRNYATLDIDLCERGAVIVGENGCGKSNILEAIHLLCTGRSPRGAHRGEMLQFNTDTAFAAGEFRSADTVCRPAHFGFSRDKKLSLLLDGKKIDSLTAWFGLCAIVAFGPGDVGLVDGEPSGRRRFLDMLISQSDPAYLTHLIAYRHHLLSRTLILSGSIDTTLLSICENALAASGAYLTYARAQTIAACAISATEMYRQIADKKELLALKFKPSPAIDFLDEAQWKDVFLAKLFEGRMKDARVGFCTVGPHRDDFGITLGEKPAKAFGSQGQRRSAALAIKLASVSFLKALRQGAMIFLVDDAFSELDAGRVERLCPLLEGCGQIFTAAPEAPDALKKNRPVLRIENGSIQKL